jgi:hypothetical protein
VALASSKTHDIWDGILEDPAVREAHGEAAGGRAKVDADAEGGPRQRF